MRGASEKRLLTDIITLVRHAMGEDEELVPFRDLVEARLYEWLAQQERAGRTFSSDQLEGLELIKGYLATSLSVEPEDFELPPFKDQGGRFKAVQLFGRDGLRDVMRELNGLLAA